VEFHANILTPCNTGHTAPRIIITPCNTGHTAPHHVTLVALHHVTLHHTAQPLARCVMSFPLMLGHDVRNQTADTLRILTNEKILNVSADALGRPARLVAGDLTSQTQVYLRQLHTGRCSWNTCVFSLFYYFVLRTRLLFCPLFCPLFSRTTPIANIANVCTCVMVSVCVCRWFAVSHFAVVASQ
jgi:hypothetical protein